MQVIFDAMHGLFKRFIKKEANMRYSDPAGGTDDFTGQNRRPEGTYDVEESVYGLERTPGSLLTRNLNLIVIAFFVMVYLVLPTRNSSIDAYYYAASIRNSGELFHPHHLLYNVTGYLIIKAFGIIGIRPDVLAFMKVLNALMAGLCLLILSRILLRMSRIKGEITGFILIAGSTFAVWRFATENETYLFPLVLSLLATLNFLIFLHNKRYLYLAVSGSFCALAILYHQIHFFWWFGLLTGTVYYIRKARAVLFYGLPALFIPLVYLVIFISLRSAGDVEGPYTHFVFREYYSGGVETGIGWSNLYLTLINFIRSYFQLHGIMFVMVWKHILFILPGILVLVLLVISIVRSKITRRVSQSTSRIFINIHILIFILQLVFAFYSVGNAEFMVMLPVLSLLILTGFLEIKPAALIYLGSALFIWNLCYGILPSRRIEYTHHSDLIPIILSHKSDLFIIESDQHILSRIYYETGIEEHRNIQKAPEDMLRKEQSLTILEERIEKTLLSGNKVFTDCIGQPVVVSRASLLDRGVDEKFFESYITVPVDSFSTYAGIYYLYEVKGLMKGGWNRDVRGGESE